MTINHDALRGYAELYATQVDPTGVFLVNHALVDLLAVPNERGGAEFREVLRGFGKVLARELMMVADFGQRPTVIAVPRGGILVGRGVMDAAAADSSLIISNSGKHRDTQEPVLPKNLSAILTKSTGVIIADGIIGRGNTIIEHLRAVFANMPYGWDGSIAVLSAIASAPGLQAIREEFSDVKMSFITGRVVPENDCGFVNFGTQEDPKWVYFVGKSLNIGDFGDMVELGINYQELCKQ